jgi:hypothetical protein
MIRFSFEKENGELLRLILTRDKLELEEFKAAVDSWKKRWKLFSEGEDTKVRQEPNGQIVFSDDTLLYLQEKWSIRRVDEKWEAFCGDKTLPLTAIVQEAFIIEP